MMPNCKCNFNEYFPIYKSEAKEKQTIMINFSQPNLFRISNIAYFEQNSIIGSLPYFVQLSGLYFPLYILKLLEYNF